MKKHGDLESLINNFKEDIRLCRQLIKQYEAAISERLGFLESRSKLIEEYLSIRDEPKE